MRGSRQGFTGIVMQLEASDQALDGDPARAREHLDRARRSSRDGLTEIRQAVHALRPDALHDATLAEALERAVSGWSRQAGVPATFLVDGSPRPLPPEPEIALLRSAQEALANISRHAGAGKVSVRLAYNPDRVALVVSDDGSGFDPDGAGADGGAGLTGMAERMSTHGGRLTVDSSPAEGTTLTAEVPAP